MYYLYNAQYNPNIIMRKICEHSNGASKNPRALNLSRETPCRICLPLTLNNIPRVIFYREVDSSAVCVICGRRMRSLLPIRELHGFGNVFRHRGLDMISALRDSEFSPLRIHYVKTCLTVRNRVSPRHEKMHLITRPPKYRQVRRASLLYNMTS